MDLQFDWESKTAVIKGLLATKKVRRGLCNSWRNFITSQAKEREIRSGDIIVTRQIAVLQKRKGDTTKDRKKKLPEAQGL